MERKTYLQRFSENFKWYLSDASTKNYNIEILCVPSTHRQNMKKKNGGMKLSEGVGITNNFVEKKIELFKFLNKKLEHKTRLHKDIM